MGLIVRFVSAAAKTAFLERLETEVPRLREGARESKTDPCTLTLAYQATGEGELIRKLVGPDSLVFDDIQMRTF